MTLDNPEIKEKVQKCLDELEKKLGRNPEDFESVSSLPSDLFTDASKERLVAVVDFYNRLKDAKDVQLICLVVNGSAAHGYAKPNHDVDIFPVYGNEDHLRVYSFINALTEELTQKYGFEISPKPVPYSILERVVLSTADNPPYFVLGRREEFYKVFRTREAT